MAEMRVELNREAAAGLIISADWWFFPRLENSALGGTSSSLFMNGRKCKLSGMN
jgi:hypothetical protein